MPSIQNTKLNFNAVCTNTLKQYKQRTHTLMVVIRMARTGAKKKPFYHVVVADKRMPRDGRYIEKVGYYNPVSQGKATRLELNRELIKSWIAKGAQPSPRVSHLIRAYDLGTMTTEAIETKSAAKKASAKTKEAKAPEKESAKSSKEESAPEADAASKETKQEAKKEN